MIAVTIKNDHFFSQHQLILKLHYWILSYSLIGSILNQLTFTYSYCIVSFFLLGFIAVVSWNPGESAGSPDKSYLASWQCLYCKSLAEERSFHLCSSSIATIFDPNVYRRMYDSSARIASSLKQMFLKTPLTQTAVPKNSSYSAASTQLKLRFTKEWTSKPPANIGRRAPTWAHWTPAVSSSAPRHDDRAWTRIEVEWKSLNRFLYTSLYLRVFAICIYICSTGFIAHSSMRMLWAVWSSRKLENPGLNWAQEWGTPEGHLSLSRALGNEPIWTQAFQLPNR